MSRELHVFETASLAADHVVRMIVDAQPSSIALSGGSSPKPLYRKLRELGALRDADVWLVDERCVPIDHPDSNAKLVTETLGPSTLHHPPTEFGCDVAASIYDEELRAQLGDEPVFDLMVLGMGPDGHTASLFPDAPEIEERVHAAVSTKEPHVGHRRITLTLPVLNRARCSIMFVVGIDKAEAFARVQEGELVPAARVLGATWVLDMAAATPPAEPPPKRRRYDPIEGQQSLFEL
ncbi:MAG: 6-phosphogluconolactonase [Actinomycetota bacterium]